MRMTMRSVLVAGLTAAAVAGGALGLPRSSADASQPDQPRQPGGSGGGGQPGGPGGRPGGPGGERAPSMSGSMRAVNRALRDLEASLGNPAMKEQSIQSVLTMARGTINARAARLPAGLEGDPAQVTADLRRRLIRVSELLLELEVAVLDEKPDEARAILAKVKEARDASHKELGIEEDEADEGGAGGGR